MLARSAAIVAASLGAAVLTGWWLREESLTRVLPGWPAANANAALMWLLGSASLWLLAPSSPSRRARIAGRLFALALLLVAVLTLFEYALDASFGIDHLLVGGEDVARVIGHRRVSPQALTAYVLLAAALLVMDRPLVRGATSQVLAVLSGGISLLALLGYLFDVPAMYAVGGFAPLVGMGLPTTFAILVLSAGVIIARPETGFVAIVTSRGQGGVAARSLFLGVIAIAPIALALQLMARAGLLPGSLAAALIVFLGFVFGTVVTLRTAGQLDRRGTELNRALDDATQWKHFFERSALGAAVESPSGTIVAANPAFAALHGRALAEVVGKSMKELFAPEEREQLDEALAALRPGEHRSLESRVIGPEGRELLAVIDATAVADAEGRLGYRAIHVRDVSEARRAELDRARLASLVESSDDAIVAKTLDGRILSWNQAAERMYGYSAEEMIGESMMLVVPDDRVAELEGFMAALRRGERVRSHETVRLRKDGSRFPVSLTLSPILDGEGHIMGASATGRDISRRRELEDALQRSEQQYRALFEQAPDGIFLADLDGRYTDVNRAGAAMLGYAREEIVGKTIIDLLRAQDVGRLLASREAMLRGGVEVGEWVLRRADGSFLPVEVSAKILPDGRWQGFVRDIGDRKRAEAEIVRAHETERQLRRELERVMGASSAVADALASVPETSLAVALKAIALQAQTLTGARYAALGIGTDPEQPFHPWVFVGMTDEEARAIGRPPRPVGTLGLPAREGQMVRVARVSEEPRFRGLPPAHPPLTSYMGVPIHFRGRAVGNIYLANKIGAEEFDADDERIVHMLATRTGAAIELARLYDTESLQRIWLQTLFDQMPEAVLILDERGRVMQQNHASRATARDTGRVDPWGNPILHDLRTPEGAEIAVEELPQYRALVHRTTEAGRELTLLGPSGELVPVIASAAPISTERGGAGAVLVFQDIRALKELERLREEWASVVAHDLRQPVAVIGLAAQVLSLSDAQRPEPERKALARIRTAASRLDRMIGDLLDFSRIEAKRMSLRRHVVDLRALVDRTVDDLREVTSRYQVRVGGAASPVLAWIDPDRIQQVLGNLLSNAAKYGEAGTEISVSVRCSGDRAEIAVTNRGPGIPADELHLLFSRFVRTRETRRGRTPGLGLGLYITRGLVEAHGGHISAESVVGETTTFRFTIPTIASKQAEVTPIAAPAHAE